MKKTTFKKGVCMASLGGAMLLGTNLSALDLNRWSIDQQKGNAIAEVAENPQFSLEEKQAEQIWVKTTNKDSEPIYYGYIQRVSPEGSVENDLQATGPMGDQLTGTPASAHILLYGLKDVSGNFSNYPITCYYYNKALNGDLGRGVSLQHLNPNGVGADETTTFDKLLGTSVDIQVTDIVPVPGSNYYYACAFNEIDRCNELIGFRIYVSMDESKQKTSWMSEDYQVINKYTTDDFHNQRLSLTANHNKIGLAYVTDNRLKYKDLTSGVEDSPNTIICESSEINMEFDTNDNPYIACTMWDCRSDSNYIDLVYKKGGNWYESKTPSYLSDELHEIELSLYNNKPYIAYVEEDVDGVKALYYTYMNDDGSWADREQLASDNNIHLRGFNIVNGAPMLEYEAGVKNDTYSIYSMAGKFNVVDDNNSKEDLTNILKKQ